MSLNKTTWVLTVFANVTWHLCGLHHVQNVSDIQPGESREDWVQSPQHRWGLFRWIHHIRLHFIMEVKADYL